MRQCRRLSAILSLALVLIAPQAVPATVTVASIAPGSEDPFITGMTVEDFEDVDLFSGLSVTFSRWLNSGNTNTGAAPVTYADTLPRTWTCAASGLGGNAWDGTRALVNGLNHGWAYPYAADIKLTFDPPRDAVGVGLSNFQRDLDSGLTYHALRVNGVFVTRLESLTGWVSTVFSRNRYLRISGEPIETIEFVAETHFDGMVLDKLAIGAATSPAASTTWGRLKRLYR